MAALMHLGSSLNILAQPSQDGSFLTLPDNRGPFTPTEAARLLENRVKQVNEVQRAESVAILQSRDEDCVKEERRGSF